MGEMLGRMESPPAPPRPHLQLQGPEAQGTLPGALGPLHDALQVVTVPAGGGGGRVRGPGQGMQGKTTPCAFSCLPAGCDVGGVLHGEVV